MLALCKLVNQHTHKAVVYPFFSGVGPGIVGVAAGASSVVLAAMVVLPISLCLWFRRKQPAEASSSQRALRAQLVGANDSVTVARKRQSSKLSQSAVAAALAGES